MRTDVLKTYYDSLVGGGHQCGDRTYTTIRNKYYWPKMYSDVENYAKHCHQCQLSKRLPQSAWVPLHPSPVVDIF